MDESFMMKLMNFHFMLTLCFIYVDCILNISAFFLNLLADVSHIISLFTHIKGFKGISARALRQNTLENKS